MAATDAQHSAAAATHAGVLDQLAQLQAGRLGALHRQFAGDLAAMRAEYEG